VTALWRKIQLQNFRSWKDLAQFLELDEVQQEHFLTHSQFPLNLPRRLAEKIEKKTTSDPILLQFVPSRKEGLIDDRYSLDPVQDKFFQKAPKFLQKYPGRALLVCTRACAMHCRYCFRKNFPYEVDRKDFSEEIELLRQDTSIKEVILSGGDPLSLSDLSLDHLLQELSLISHIKRIRFHTRFPIGIPERLDSSFLKILKQVPKQIYFIVHVNHPKELDPDIFTALKEVQKLGIPVLNQAVLLKGINDSVDTLQELCERLSDQGIIPYYLHQLDQVQGAAHFEVPLIQGQQLIHALTSRLSGYSVPKYVREIPGELSKTSLI
jgi:EF-P beta-lysylation protein EpmB